MGYYGVINGLIDGIVNYIYIYYYYIGFLLGLQNLLSLGLPRQLLQLWI